MLENTVDRAVEAAELDASRERRSEEIERVISASSVSSSSSEASHRGVGMSRIETQRDLERHQTELSRIHTARSQHSGTVGRAKSKEWKTPLPNFGAGKPYPPLLPNQEDYVVEFDGPDDPLHAQNWPLRKKYVYSPPLTLYPLFMVT
jgi:DHA1 family multidrug resistance protein-like MFS transporter